MLSTKTLVLNLENSYSNITIKVEEDFDFNDNSKAYILLDGKVLSYGERDYTQLLKKNDPIGFAEAIVAKKHVLKYRRLTDIKLLEFDAKEIRQMVNESNIVVKALIKYSLARVFISKNSKNKSHYLFEDEFVHKNWKLLETHTYNDEAIIFLHGYNANNMYFIEKGKVKLTSKDNKLIKVLKNGESFGEVALLRGRKRNNSALAIGPTTLKIIRGGMISKLIDVEKPIVQLALLSLAKKLEIINGIRSADHHNKLKQHGLIT